MRLLINLLVVCFVTSSSLSFAEEVDYDSQIRMFDSAAKALYLYHPIVSAELTQYAHDQILWKEETKENKNEEEYEKAEMLTKDKRVAHIKLLRDSAVFLQYSNPELSTTLIALADRKSKRILEVSSK